MKSIGDKILIVDDDEKILFAFQKVFESEGYRSFVASNGEEALDKLTSVKPDVIFMDITMPKLDGLEALRRMKEQNPIIPVILITGFGTMQTAIKAMKYGAFEYLTKPLDIEKVRDVARRALLSIRNQIISSEGQVSFTEDIVNRYDIVGNCDRMQEIYKLIGSISTTPNHTSILIFGESGTGKELVARAIHANSAHAHESFIPINCTVLPEALLESELFGHEKGAFTGAIDRKIGKFELAGRGSIFLDEIGNLTLHLQQKLLRVLQEREFERIGGNTHLQVEARFIAATNQDLATEVKNKNFREDLFFRLNVVSVYLPPLRERKGDIPLLANYFLSKYNAQLKKTIKGFAENAMTLLQAYSFPGNVRELENLIERAVMLTRGDILLPEVVSERVVSSAPNVDQLQIISEEFSQSREHLINIFERQFITEQLTSYRGNVTFAAKKSKMTRQNFQRLMKKYNIKAERFRR